jgi:hypothetical protein
MATSRDFAHSITILCIGRSSRKQVALLLPLQDGCDDNHSITLRSTKGRGHSDRRHQRERHSPSADENAEQASAAACGWQRNRITCVP